MDADEAEVVVVSAALLLPRSGTGDRRQQTSMGEKDAGATRENMAGADHLTVVIVSREEEGGEEDMVQIQTTTTVKGDPLPIMVLTHSPHLRPRRTPRTQRRLSLSRRRTHSLFHPLRHHLRSRPL